MSNQTELPTKVALPDNNKHVTFEDLRKFYSKYKLPFRTTPPPLKKYDFVLAYIAVDLGGKRWVPAIVHSFHSDGNLVQVYLFNFGKNRQYESTTRDNISWPWQNHTYDPTRGLFSDETELPVFTDTVTSELVKQGFEQYNDYVESLLCPMLCALKQGTIGSYKNASWDQKNRTHTGHYVLNQVYDLIFGCIGTYEGSIVNNQREDKNGKFKSTDLEQGNFAFLQYEGEWKNDRPCGEAMISFHNFTVYKGSNRLGLPHGFGSLCINNCADTIWRNWEFLPNTPINAFTWAKCAVQDQSFIMADLFVKDHKINNRYYGQANGISDQKPGKGVLIDNETSWIYAGTFVDRNLHGFGVAMKVTKQTQPLVYLKIGFWTNGRLTGEGLCVDLTTGKDIGFYSQTWNSVSKGETVLQHGHVVNIKHHQKSKLLLNKWNSYAKVALSCWAAQSQWETPKLFTVLSETMNIKDPFMEDVVVIQEEKEPIQTEEAVTCRVAIPAIYDHSLESWYYSETGAITEILQTLQHYKRQDLKKYTETSAFCAIVEESSGDYKSALNVQSNKIKTESSKLLEIQNKLFELSNDFSHLFM